MSDNTKSGRFKWYCKILTLKDDPELIEEYIRIHAKENVWPEVREGMKQVGILDMEIYIHGNHLFMIMDTESDFDHDKAMKELAYSPRQQEWEEYVARFQETEKDSSADEKWQLMEGVFELDQQQEYPAEEGQMKMCPGAK